MTGAARGSIVLVAACAGALIAAVALPAAAPPQTDANDASSLVFQPHPGMRLPLATPLVDEDGRAASLGGYFAKAPVILVLDYLRCTSLCGVTLHNLVDTLDRLPLEPGRDYQLVAVSIDPRDRPADAAAARAKYVGLLGRDTGARGLHFLTASSPAAVREIADAVGFPYRYDALSDAYIHPAGFVVAAPDGVITRYVEGVAISPDELVGAVADAELDKSQGPLTRLLLLCHVSGAPIGRLTVPVLAALITADIAAGFTLIAIFAAIRRRRHG